jgi:hypothetical protein
MKTFIIETSDKENHIICPVGHGNSDVLVIEVTDGKETGGRFFETIEEAEKYVNKCKINENKC